MPREPAPPSILFSASPEYFEAAAAELRRAVDQSGRVDRIGPDAGVFRAAAADIVLAAGACTTGEVRFVRHLASVRGVLALAPDVTSAAGAVLELVPDVGAPALAVQVWSSGKSPARAESLRHEIVRQLDARHVPARRSGAPLVLAVCLGQNAAVVGLTASHLCLSDWPGGRVRLAVSPDQVSRAEFKLEELFTLYPVKAGGSALDLGASPGGWTRILRSRGCRTVAAVDPGDLDARVKADSGVRHYRMTAGEFLRRPTAPFDIVVNDMRMVPPLSARVMTDAATHLRRGGLCVVTLKLESFRPAVQVDRALKILRQNYTVEFARQLQHNRHEITVVARLAAPVPG